SRLVDRAQPDGQDSAYRRQEIANHRGEETRKDRKKDPHLRSDEGRLLPGRTSKLVAGPVEIMLPPRRVEARTLSSPVSDMPEPDSSIDVVNVAQDDPNHLCGHVVRLIIRNTSCRKPL